MEEQEAYDVRPLPEPDEGQPIDLSGGPISAPDFILGLGVGAVGTYLLMVILWALTR